MKSPVFIVPAAVLATATAVAILVAQAGDRSPTLDPGFVPNTGQINSGHAAEPWSDALPQEEPPSQEEARAALMMPDDGTPSAGQGSAGQIPQRAANHRRHLRFDHHRNRWTAHRRHDTDNAGEILTAK